MKRSKFRGLKIAKKGVKNSKHSREIGLAQFSHLISSIICFSKVYKCFRNLLKQQTIIIIIVIIVSSFVNMSSPRDIPAVNLGILELCNGVCLIVFTLKIYLILIQMIITIMCNNNNLAIFSPISARLLLNNISFSFAE